MHHKLRGKKVRFIFKHEAYVLPSGDIRKNVINSILMSNVKNSSKHTVHILKYQLNILHVEIGTVIYCE